MLYYEEKNIYSNKKGDDIMFEEMNIFTREELVDLYKFYTEPWCKARLVNAESNVIIDLDKHRSACAEALRERNWFVKRD